MIKNGKRVFYTELSYVFALITMAFGAAFTELAGLGMSMVVAPTYILHLKISEFLPWFTFGVAEYFVQGLLILITALVMKRFKISYIFSFVTAIFYGALLDGAMLLISPLPNEALGFRILWFVIGSLFCAIAV